MDLRKNPKIRSVVIDDEEWAIQTLIGLIDDFCEEIEVIGTGTSVKTGVSIINKLQPQLVFLDIDMLDGFGFDILEQTNDLNYGVIFTTAYSTYAAKAFEFAAIHYLLKPISVDGLVDAVERFKRQNLVPKTEQVQVLKETFTSEPEKIALHHDDEHYVLDLKQILYFESDNGNTFIHGTDGSKNHIANSLSHFEGLLGNHGFYRTHAKYIVNLTKVSKFTSLGRSGTAQLVDGTRIPVASRRKPEFNKKLKDLAL